ncbi:MAG: hypothetical protein ACLGJE_09435 [Gammaproteobacteria bacterium]
MDYRFEFDKKPDGITRRDFDDATDLYATWTITSTLPLSTVYGLAMPGDRASRRTLTVPAPIYSKRA